MSRAAAVMLWLCLFAAGLAGGETLPAKGAVDSRIRAVPYNSDEVYRLYGFVGYQIDLEFEAGETFVGLGAGDLEGLAFVGKDNHLFLKPKAAKLATNLTVLTSRRHYQFDYTASDDLPLLGDPMVIYALRFIYPSTPPAMPRETPPAARPPKTAQRDRRATRNRVFAGTRAVRRRRPSAAAAVVVGVGANPARRTCTALRMGRVRRARLRLRHARVMQAASSA